MGNHFHLVVETPQGSLVEGTRWLRNLEAKAKRFVAEELKKLGGVGDDLARRRESDPATWPTTARLRWETTLTVKALALRSHLGSPKSANARLWQWPAAQKAEARAASSR